MMASRRWYKSGAILIGMYVLIVCLVAVLWLVQPAATLNSLEQVDDYPLYVMHYYGPYEKATSTADFLRQFLSTQITNSSQSQPQLAWVCSLFAALGDPDHKLYGRNFDWQFSPALLLFTDPPDGYASVSMVDIAYLGYSRPDKARALTDMSLVERGGLLFAPFLPFDGMNEHGLVVGMAAVPPGGMRPDPNKETVDSLMIIREILDHARDVDEAVALMERYNIDMGGGPPIHYLIADASGQAVLVEFYQGNMHVIPNQTDWHLATNFLLTAVGDHLRGTCWRYDTIYEKLSQTQGRILSQEAMDLLANVSQGSTQWSVVYEMSTGDVNVAMGRDYEDVNTLHLSLAGE